jgi:O-antigen/teichoic acid export membrane protein
MTRALVANVARVYLVQAFSALLGLLLVPVALSRFGPEGYALWSIYALLQGYIVLAELGLGKNLVQQLAATKNDALREDLLRRGAAAYILVAVGAVLALPVLLIAIEAVFSVPAKQLVAARLIAGLAVLDYVLGLPVGLKQSMTIADQAFDRFSRFASASAVLRFGLPLLAVIAGLGPVAAVAAALSRRLPEYWLARLLFRPMPPDLWSPRLRWQELRGLVAPAMWLSATQAMQVTMISLASLMIGWLGGFAALGSFRALFDLVSKIWFVSSGLGIVLFPFFSKIVSDASGASRLRLVLRGALRASWVGFWCLGILGTVLGGPILEQIGFTERSQRLTFACLTLGMISNAHANIAYEFLQAQRRFRTVFVLNLAGTAGIGVLGMLLPIDDVGERVAIAWAMSQLVYAIAADATALQKSYQLLPILGHRLVVVVGALSCATLGFGHTLWPISAAGAVLVAWAVRDGVRTGIVSWRQIGLTA